MGVVVDTSGGRKSVGHTSVGHTSVDHDLVNRTSANRTSASPTSANRASANRTSGNLPELSPQVLSPQILSPQMIVESSQNMDAKIVVSPLIPAGDFAAGRVGHVQLVRPESSPVTPLVAGAAGAKGKAIARRWKWPLSYRSIEFVAIIADVAIIIASSILAGEVYSLFIDGSQVDPFFHLGLSAMVAALYVAVMKERGLYKPTELLEWTRQLRLILIAWIGVLLFLSGCVFALKSGSLFSRMTVGLFAVMGLVGLLAHRTFWRMILAKALASGRLAGRDIILISEGANVAEVVKNLWRHGFRVHRHIALLGGGQRPERWDEAMAQAVAYSRASRIDEVFVAADPNQIGDWHPALERLRILPTRVNLIPIGPCADLLRRPAHMIGGETVVELQRAPLTLFESTIKRTVDVVVAAAALIALMPLMLIAAIAIKLDSAGPVIFRQTRNGYNGRPFDILKFRTMTVLENGDCVKQAARDDNRITRVGTWLRRTSIDELPQLFNVIKGDMSVVGPRPHATSHDSHFDKNIANYSFRQRMRPGLTGLAQVNGCRGETPTLNSMERRVDFDLEYIENWSLRLDFVITLRTLVTIVRGQNAY